MKIKYKKNIHGQEKTFTLMIELENDFGSVKCENENGEEMGFLTFKPLEDSLWLYKIETHQEFAHQGVASAIIDVVEHIAMTKRKRTLEGKYYPFNDYAKPFYEKNGWFIPNQKGGWDDYDETWHMFKDLDFKKIKNEISNNIEVIQENEDENV